jgi:hypothetical protein
MTTATTTKSLSAKSRWKSCASLMDLLNLVSSYCGNDDSLLNTPSSSKGCQGGGKQSRVNFIGVDHHIFQQGFVCSDFLNLANSSPMVARFNRDVSDT